MKSLIVVENPKRWPFSLEGVEVVAAWAYLVEPRFAELKRAAVYNLCRRLGYQTVGYYVSLLAAARGHRPLPSVVTSQALQDVLLVRSASEELDAEIQRALGRLRSDDFLVRIYFGRTVAQRHARLARALFNQFPAPFLIARFQRVEVRAVERVTNASGLDRVGPPEGQDPASVRRDPTRWRLAGLRLGAASEIPDSHRDFVIESGQGYFAQRHQVRAKAAFRHDLAVLWSEEDEHAPSDDAAIRRFVRAAERQRIRAEVIGPEDYGRIAEYDGLFIRQTTYVNHHTYRFATRAAAEGLVVVDEPEAIVRSTNKVYQAELFARHGIPAPRTHVMHEGNANELVARVGLPCVLKKPDGAFSLGVVKVETPEEAGQRLSELLPESELVIAQEFVPSDFDWRVGVLDREPLFVCRYHMARGHWQIVSRSGRTERYGRVEAVAIEEAPAEVVATAVRAASLFGDGLFGVDLKVVDGRIMVMEVNDNPNIDAGFEDAILKDTLYDRIVSWFATRLDRRGQEHQK